MRRLMCLLLAVAAVSVSSIPIGASARQASATAAKSTIGAKDLGKLLGGAGAALIFWTPGVWTGFGTLTPNGDVYYTPGSVPIPPRVKNCGATYASLQRFCQFQTATHAVTCHPS